MKLTWECRDLTVSVSCKEDRLEEDEVTVDLESCAWLLSDLISHMQFCNPEYILALCLEHMAMDHSMDIYSEVDRLQKEMFMAAKAYRVARDEEYDKLVTRAAAMQDAKEHED